jgi:hypothetical protein
MRPVESHCLWPAGAVPPPSAAPFLQGCDRRATLSVRQMMAFPQSGQARDASADPAAVVAGEAVAPARVPSGMARVQVLRPSRPADRHSCCVRGRLAGAGEVEAFQLQVMANAVRLPRPAPVQDAEREAAALAAIRVPIAAPVPRGAGVPPEAPAQAQAATCCLRRAALPWAGYHPPIPAAVRRVRVPLPLPARYSAQPRRRSGHRSSADARHCRGARG